MWIPTTPLRAISGIHYPDQGKECIVEIQFFHPASVWVSEKLWLPSQKIVKLKDDSIIFTARVDGLKKLRNGCWDSEDWPR